MAMLQGMIPLLQMSDVNFSSLDSDTSQGLQIVAKIPTLIAYYHRIQEGLPLIEFRPEMSYLESFLMMFNGQAAEEQSIEVLKVAQILQLEHSFNAGTFASKCVSSTLASINACVQGGVLPVWQQGSSDTKTVEPVGSILQLFNALISALSLIHI